jgi:hypothetical protein
MRTGNRRRSLGTGLSFLLIIFLALVGCAGRRDGPLPVTARVPTIVATGDRAGTQVARTATAEAAETVVPVVDSATPTPLHTPASTSIRPQVVISPTNGPAGTQVRVVAAGFRPETTITLGLGHQGGPVETTITIQSDATGRAVFQLVIPDAAEVGELWLVVAQVLGQPVQAVSNLFAVTERQAAQTVEVSPRRASPGVMLTITGAGFPSEARIEIGLGHSGSEPAILATGQTHADGTIEVAIEVPDSVAPGDDWVVTVATPNQEQIGVSEPLVIVAAEPVVELTTLPMPTEGVPTATASVAPTPIPLPTAIATETPTPIPLPTATAQLTGPSVLLYFIALDDAGQRGPHIGCGDSVLPVPVRISPTLGVLRAAMEQLVAIQDLYYGDSGLYNALHMSDLTVGAINIAAGHATIHLSGSLVAGGACDAPRIQAQLEQTALQFSTVDRVTIMINGQPLTSALSQE